jgi:hypothetical protein
VSGGIRILWRLRRQRVPGVAIVEASTAASAARIFISYRREETAWPAGWLFNQLEEHFGKGQVFKDVDSIRPGDDFAEVITAAVADCDVLLALIGDRWLTIAGEDGHRRLDDPDDFVRLEIQAALAHGVLVIPVLIGGAVMPSREELPTSLARMVRFQAVELSPNHFEADTERLLRALDNRLAEAQARRDDKEAAGAGRSPYKRDSIPGPDLRPYVGISRTTTEYQLIASAMEGSLAYQGKRIALNREAYFDELVKHSDLPPNEEDQYAFTRADWVEIASKIGIPSDPPGRSYRAHVTRVRSGNGIIKHLDAGRPVIATARITNQWLDPEVKATGRFPREQTGMEGLLGYKMILILAWDSAEELFGMTVPWPEWGDRGIGWLPDLRHFFKEYISEADAIEGYEVNPEDSNGTLTAR